jgi:hypothetical protein
MTYGVSYTTIGRNIGQKMVLPLIHLGLDAMQHLKCCMSFVLCVCVNNNSCKC